jgi:hypothetical protein
MWTDMSEIVRPTRDGIHGREYISTGVDLGRRLNHLTFDTNGQLISEVPNTVDISLPILFDMPANNLSLNVREALIKAAAEINTRIIMLAADITPEFDKYSGSIVPLLTPKEIDKYRDIIKKSRLVAIEYSNAVLKDLPGLQEKFKKLNNAIIIIRVTAAKNIEDTVVKLAHNGAEVIHIEANYCGREFGRVAGPDRRFLKDIIRAVHLKLVEERIRDEVTLIASGGIAMAEYVPKAMLCGADLTAVDLPLVIALGARLYEEPEKLLIFPEGFDKVPSSIMTQRIVNLMGAWHSQILEMMGAMGIREARRLRGESGRAIFFEEIDKDTFGNLFKKREVESL